MIIVDNFLPYPNVVREWALNQKFYNCEELSQLTGFKNTWPGLRTITVNELDNRYADVVLTRIASIAASFFSTTSAEIKSSFQLTRETDGDSWVHVDNDVQVAGLLYLTPNAPYDSGTTIYDNFQKPVDLIGNVYNRLVLYNADKYHKSNKYFGSDLRTGRLTQVFFIKG